MGNRQYKGLRALLIVLLVFVIIFVLGIVMLGNYDGYDKGGIKYHLFLFVLVDIIWPG